MKTTQFTAARDQIEVREDGDGDAMYRIRLPVSSTGSVRNDGDPAFDEARLEAFAEQIRNGAGAGGAIAVHLDHGKAGLGNSRYSALGKIGRWESPTVEREGDLSLLYADAAIVDPDALDLEGPIGDVENALRWLKTQAEVGVPISASVGWSESGGRDLPGDVDLQEISLVGIGADPNATTAAAPEPVTRGFDTIAENTDEQPPSAPAGFRAAFEDDDVVERMKVKSALEDLREFCELTRDRRSDRDKTPKERRARWRDSPLHHAVDDLLEEFDHGRRSSNVGQRLEGLSPDVETRDAEQGRERVHDLLDTIESEFEDYKRRVRARRVRAPGSGPKVEQATSTIRRALEPDREPTFSFSERPGGEA